MCIGDFNEVLHQHEHDGVGDRSLGQIAGFRDAVDVCELVDLGFEGSMWTFEKRVVGGSFCRVRLDRALATPAWNARFPLATVNHLTGVTSDHKPIILRWAETRRERRRMEDKIFRYELMWESHEQFRPHVADSWQAQGPAGTMTELKAKLTRLSSSLDVWGRNTFGSVQKEIRELEFRLGVLQSSTDRQGPSEEESRVVERLAALYQREETMWRQRSRVQWLAEGDKNTRFFHLRASQRKKKNRVARLMKPDGSTTEDDGEMAQLTGEFYADLYRSEGVSNMEEVIDVIPHKVTAQMNDTLLKPIKGEEVKSALFQMFPTKAPGPDGYPAHFFQTHWDLCGEEVTAAVLRVLRGEDNMAEINQTFVNYLKDLELSKRTVQQPAAATETIAPRWIPPPTGMVKINVDAAVGKNLKRGSVAAIARSSDGVFLGASALIYPGVTEAETLEALACREACDLARDIYASRVRVASDCKMVVQYLEQGTRGVYSHIITEIIEARQSFAFLEFKFESRKSNNEAHKLARSALCDVSGRRVWLDAPPEGMCIPVVID
ncbi:hypothetical protein QYE76_013748 [Lolium multiflorum]|uniref:RNase H type-1 domain-containing protein n=1 Tax=Lolium multiflorum TaxID=4521 RepID=A0AAD8X568_LOLMU|nr:hypothetical protein QYE76_013748 [Lolium multiflorum]